MSIRPSGPGNVAEGTRLLQARDTLVTRWPVRSAPVAEGTRLLQARDDDRVSVARRLDWQVAEGTRLLQARDSLQRRRRCWRRRNKRRRRDRGIRQPQGPWRQGRRGRGNATPSSSRPDVRPSKAVREMRGRGNATPSSSRQTAEGRDRRRARAWQRERDSFKLATDSSRRGALPARSRGRGNATP